MDVSVQSDALRRAETSQGSFGKVCVVVSDDVVWYAIPGGDVGGESYLGSQILPPV
mgnify:CR=1 FL=1